MPRSVRCGVRRSPQARKNHAASFEVVGSERSGSRIKDEGTDAEAPMSTVCEAMTSQVLHGAQGQRQVREA
jgi:hypothetical protein